MTLGIYGTQLRFLHYKRQKAAYICGFLSVHLFSACDMVETERIELLTSALRTQRSRGVNSYS